MLRTTHILNKNHLPWIARVLLGPVEYTAYPAAYYI